MHGLVVPGIALREPRLARAVSLLGARCLMTGIGPSVSQSMVALGIHLGDLATLRSVKHGLRHILEHKSVGSHGPELQ